MSQIGVDLGTCRVCDQDAMDEDGCRACGAVSCDGCGEHFEPRNPGSPTAFSRERHCADCLIGMAEDAADLRADR